MTRAGTMHLAPGHAAFDSRVFHKECRTLAQAGYDVTLVVPHTGSETVSGVKIVPLPRARSRFERFLRNTWRVFLLAWRERADVYHLHDAETLPVGALLALAGRRVIYDSHEDLPRLARDRPWIPRWLRPAASFVVRCSERACVAVFQAVISAEAEGANRFPAARTTIVRNYALEEEFAGVTTQWPEREQRAVYVGDITYQRGVVEMIDAVDACRDLGARLTLIGRMSIPGMEEALQRRPGWDLVDYLGVRGRPAVVAELSRARVGLILWQATRKHAEGAVPVKLFEYMACGLAVVASDLPELRAIIEESGAGILVDPSDTPAAAMAMRALLEDSETAMAIGRRGADSVRHRYTWSSEAAKLLALYEAVLPRDVINGQATCR